MSEHSKGFKVIYMTEHHQDFIQNFLDIKNSSDVKREVDKILKSDELIPVALGRYGRLIGESYLKPEKVIAYTITKSNEDY